jgi:hypothetical protein
MKTEIRACMIPIVEVIFSESSPPGRLGQKQSVERPGADGQGMPCEYRFPGIRENEVFTRKVAGALGARVVNIGARKESMFMYLVREQFHARLRVFPCAECGGETCLDI